MSKLETKLIHSGEEYIEGSVITPHFTSSTYLFDGQDNYHNIKYARLSTTPNHTLLNKKFIDISGYPSAIVTTSGMSAISSTLLSLLNYGDHILIQKNIYGGTYAFINQDLKKLNITYSFIDANNPANWNEKLNSNTKIIYIESISNPLLEVPDIEAVVTFAKQNNLISVIDNTFSTPLGFLPSQYDIDICLHSCTKYLNGHSDVIAGAIIGKSKYLNNIKPLIDHLGSSLDTHSCYQLNRGMKTLHLRYPYQVQNAEKIALFLTKQKNVSRVYYPGIESHPTYKNAKKYLNYFGAVVGFELNKNLKDFLSKISIFKNAPSLGGVESILSVPALTSHASLGELARKESGISDQFVRLSLGIENSIDLIADLEKALN